MTHGSVAALPAHVTVRNSRHREVFMSPILLPAAIVGIALLFAIGIAVVDWLGEK